MTTHPNTFRSLRTAAAIGVATMLATGCQFGGLNSLALPGTAGHGRGAFLVTVELPDVSTLPQNSPVMIDDVTVGSIAGLKAIQRPDGTFYAAVTLALDPTVTLPANAEVRVAQTSLLGSQHIQLSDPTDTAPVGTLTGGATLPTSNASSYPTTEDVLSSLGVVVNKGNLGALEDITDELYRAVAGRAGQFGDLIPRLAELTAAVDHQTSDIITAAEHLNRFAATLARGNDQLGRALQALPAALKVLNDNGTNIVAAFAALRRLGEVAARVLAETKTDFAADLKDAYAVITPISEHVNELIDALPILPAFPLPLRGVPRAVRGDYLNSFLTLDLTVRRFGENMFTTSALDPNMKHLGDVLNPPDFLTGAMANLSGQAANPMQLPPAPTGGG